MANEARINSSLQIRKGKIDYQSRPTTFNADVTGQKGPVPGAITVDVGPGTDLDLSQLSTPGLCRVQNQSEVNFVELGLYDPETLAFYPMMEFLPGESYVIRLSRNLAEEYGSTGTGTGYPGTNRLRLRADTSPCDVLIEAFEA